MDLKELKLTPKRREICARLDLSDSTDILHYFPFRYDYLEAKHYADFREGDTVCFEGELISSPSTFRYGKKSSTRFQVLYEEEVLSIVIYNRPWARNLKVEGTLTILGRYEGRNKVTASNYYEKPLSEVAGIVPYYPLREGIGQNDIRKLIEAVYLKSQGELVEEMPEEYRNSHGLISYKEAIRGIHFPSSKEELRRSLSRLKYEEFLRFYIALQLLKGTNTSALKKAKIFDREKVEALVNSLPYELTDDQRESLNDILNDLSGEKIMYRLLQGEVGSGKTAVALIALYANHLSGYQGALMAPTEILAKQHLENARELFGPLGLQCVGIYGNMDEASKMKAMVKSGEADIIIGTHALFSEDLTFRKLGLVIADEQQRFGVKQRKKLREKGEDADFLLMSATPIPRTLASSIYGDMDISTIRTMPKGRKGCKTYLIRKNSIVDILPDIRKRLDEGRQVYIIAAAIEKNEGYKAKDVEGLYASLQDVLAPYKVSLLHGRMDSDEKDKVMKAFNENSVQVLISTTVVEVGVNVKNATMMIVYDADKFGLAQLHQLRGRIQRGEEEGTCYLLSNSKEEMTLKRLEVLTRTNDGFEISYEDLRLRGPGDILGTRQSGLPALLLGDLLADTKFMEAARKDAEEIVKNTDDPACLGYVAKIAESAAKNVID